MMLVTVTAHYHPPFIYRFYIMTSLTFENTAIQYYTNIKGNPIVGVLESRYNICKCTVSMLSKEAPISFYNTNMESFTLKAINPKIFPYYMLVFQITFYFFIYQTMTGEKRPL